MTNRKSSIRVLAVVPFSKGFGYAVLDKPFQWADWGIKNVRAEQRGQTIKKLEELVAQYTPTLLVVSTPAGKRSERIRKVIQEMIRWAQVQKLDVTTASLADAYRYCFNADDGTKQALAEKMAEAFPAEFGSRLPQERQPWKSEDPRLNIFVAAGLAVAAQKNNDRLNKMTE